MANKKDPLFKYKLLVAVLGVILIALMATFFILIFTR